MKLKTSIMAIAMVCVFAACREDRDGEITKSAGGVMMVNASGELEEAHGTVLTMADYETEITLELVSSGLQTIERTGGSPEMTVELIDNPYASAEENERLKYKTPGDRQWNHLYKQRVKISAPGIGFRGYAKFRLDHIQYPLREYWCDIEVRKTGT